MRSEWQNTWKIRNKMYWQLHFTSPDGPGQWHLRLRGCAGHRHSCSALDKCLRSVVRVGVGGSLTPCLTCTFTNVFQSHCHPELLQYFYANKILWTQSHSGILPPEHFAGGRGCYCLLLTLQMFLLASCDCNRKGGAGRAVSGKNNTAELYDYTQSKSKLLAHVSFSHTHLMRRNILSLKCVKSMLIQCLCLSFFLAFNTVTYLLFSILF